MIKVIYKVEGDSNEYDSEQEAQVAEALQETEAIYVRDYEKLRIAKKICQRYFLCPILPTVTVQEQESLGKNETIMTAIVGEPLGGQEDPMAEVNSWGASA